MSNVNSTYDAQYLNDLLHAINVAIQSGIDSGYPAADDIPYYVLNEAANASAGARAAGEDMIASFQNDVSIWQAALNSHTQTAAEVAAAEAASNAITVPLEGQFTYNPPPPPVTPSDPLPPPDPITPPVPVTPVYTPPDTQPVDPTLGIGAPPTYTPSPAPPYSPPPAPVIPITQLPQPPVTITSPITDPSGGQPSIPATVTPAVNPPTSTGFDLGGAESFWSTYTNSLWAMIFQWINDHILTPVATWELNKFNSFRRFLGYQVDINGNAQVIDGITQIKIPSTEAEAIVYEREVGIILDTPSTILEWCASWFLRTALAISAMGARLEPLLEMIRQVANSQQPVMPLDTSTLINAQYQGIINTATGQATALKSGISTQDYDTIFATAAYVPSSQDAASWLARGFIDLASYETIIAKNHANPTDGNLISAGAIKPIAPQSVITNYGKERVAGVNWLNGTLNAVAPVDVLTFYNADQTSTGQASYDWINHFNVPPPEWFASGYFRGLFTSVDVENAAIAGNYPDGLLPSWIEMSRPILPVRIVTTLFSQGVLTEFQARAAYGKAGFSDDNVNILVAYAKSLNPKVKKGLPADLSKLALNAAIALFEDGVLNVSQLSGVYNAHGYSVDAATYEIEYLELKNASAMRKQHALDIVAEVDLGQIALSAGVDQLVSGGYTSTEVLRYEKMMHKNKIAKTKVPTGAEIKAMFKAGFIVEADVEAYYLGEGYSGQWSLLLTGLVTGNITVPAA